MIKNASTRTVWKNEKIAMGSYTNKTFLASICGWGVEGRDGL